MVALFLKGIMDLVHNWGNMSSHEKQEAVAELVGGALVGLFGPKGLSEPGSTGPKGGVGPPEVAVTPEGVRVPVPERGPTAPSGPAAKRPMEMGGGEQRGGGGGEQPPPPQQQPPRQFKKPRSNQSGKAGATDIPNWAKGQRPYQGENGRAFAKRLLDEKYGPGNYDTRRPGSEYNQLQKYGDRHFE
jgi:hypothetical protein